MSQSPSPDAPPSRRRQYVLAGVLVAVAVLTAAVLFDVLGTVFFAVTVAYLLVPAQGWVVARGLPPRVASALVTTGAVLAALVPVEIIGFLLYQRREELMDVIAEIPREFAIGVGEFVYVVDLSLLLATLQDRLSALAVDIATAVPVLALKFSLFAFLLYALLVRSDDAAAAMLAPVPAAYHGVLRAFHERVRETLYAIYVLQAATAAGTFFLALPVFVLFDYPFAVTLASVAALLQFLPVVGPSILVVALAAYEVTVSTALLRPLAVLIVGLVVIAGLPDLLIRPRLASETAGISGSLYFVGFVGGLLTLGPVGIVAGPLVVALLAEATRLLAADTRDRDGTDRSSSG